jgi:hypothetical protein
MGLTEDLKGLQDLHEKRKLSDEEFAQAKAAVLKQQGSPTPVSTTRAVGRSIGSRLIPLFVLLLLLVGFFWYQRGTRATQQMIATAVHAPVTVKDEVENLPAHSWKAVALSLPYEGSLDVNLQVVQGNPLDVFVVASDQLDLLKNDHWGQVRTYTDFNAVKTKTYRRTSRLNQGDYYLVVKDNSLGILSQSASDISVKAQLNP